MCTEKSGGGGLAAPRSDSGPKARKVWPKAAILRRSLEI